MSIRLRLEHLVPEAIDALGDLIRTGPPRERVAAAREVLSWVYGDRETTRHVDIQLCAVAPEALTLDQIREEAERRRLESLGQRSQVLMSDNPQLSDTRKLRTSDDLFDAIAQIKPDSNPQ